MLKMDITTLFSIKSAVACRDLNTYVWPMVKKEKVFRITSSYLHSNK